MDNKSETENDHPIRVSSFEEYDPAILTRENLERVFTLLFDMNPEEMSGEELGRRLSEDRKVVRQKYSLPNEGIKYYKPDEYYRQLEVIAKREGVQLRERAEFETFFEERHAAGVYFRSEDLMALDQLRDNDDLTRVFSKALTLEHELIHAFQKRRYPQMKLIRQEYEAYIANSNTEVFETRPWLFLERIAMSLTPDQLDDAWSEYQTSKISRATI